MKTFKSVDDYINSNEELKEFLIQLRIVILETGLVRYTQ